MPRLKGNVRLRQQRHSPNEQFVRYDRGGPVKFSIPVGAREKHLVEFSWNQMTGALRIVVVRSPWSVVRSPW